MMNHAAIYKAHPEVTSISDERGAFDAKGKPVRLNRALVEAAAVITDAEHARLSVERNRLDAYQRESDPLYFEWQAGEGSKSAWLAKRLDIKSRFSY